jgi:hypothetical protein
MIPRTSLRVALNDPNLMGETLAGDSWRAWRVLLIAAVGEKLTSGERTLFKQLTGREREPQQSVEEFIGVIGRRGGKSRAISVLAAYIAGLCDHPALVRGERGVLLIIAPDQRQADICLDYIEANFRNSAILQQLVETRVARTLRLTNRIDIEVRASDFRRLRGPTYIAVICDESAFWPSTEMSTNPDSEILNAVRPGLATTQGPLFLISSPYARRGELWTLYRKHFGPQGDPLILVAQAASRTMNPVLRQSVVDRAMERDPISAAAEYLAQFRTDLEAFVNREAVQHCISRGVFERPPLRNVAYTAFCDPSGGSADSMSLAVGHYDAIRQTAVVDCLREVKPPFSPEFVVSQFAETLKSYRLSMVKGDRYAGEWPREQFRKFGISYEPAAKPKSELYVDLLPLINSGRIELLDHERMFNQLIGLERRTARGGRDSIDHPPGQHDDVINAVAGLASMCVIKGTYNLDALAGTGEDRDKPDTDAYLHQQLRWHIFNLSGGKCLP